MTNPNVETKSIGLPVPMITCPMQPTPESLIKFIMTDNFLSSTGTSPSAKYCRTIPALPTRLPTQALLLPVYQDLKPGKKI
jgi:hypothetical protein